MNVFVLILAGLLFLGAGPFEMDDPVVSQGVSLYLKGDYRGSLTKFEEAQRNHTADARIAYNRGISLYKLQKYPDAKEAFTQALSLDKDGSISQITHYAMGNVAADSKQPEEALREFRTALRMKPADDAARHNYEVVLRGIPPPSPDAGSPDAGQDGGSPDAGKDGGDDAGSPDAGRDGGTDGGKDSGSDSGQDAGSDAGDGGRNGAAGQGDAGDDAGNGDAGNKPQPDGGAGDTGNPSPRESASDGGGPLGKEEAERLLDAAKASEANVQPWRFQQSKPKDGANAKDW